MSPGQASAHQLFTTPNLGLVEVIVPTAYVGLDLAPADLDFQHDRAPSDDQILARALTDPAINGGYHYVLIDCPASLDRLPLNALTAANWALIPFVRLEKTPRMRGRPTGKRATR